MDYKITNCNFVNGQHNFPEFSNTNVTEIVVDDETLDDRFNLQDLEELLIGLGGSVRIGPCRGCGRVAIYKDKSYPEHDSYEDKENCLVANVLES